jgi:type II secretory pathway pseudopilin PulG
MNRQYWRACRRVAGFTMAEMLVTVTLAAIFFSALVPVMVSALNAGSGDRMRVVAANAAQDRIERIRQLDWDQVTVANLNDPDFYPVTLSDGSVQGSFGPTWQEQTASGTRTLDVTYTVDEVPVSGTDARIAYKTVTITVTWGGEPKPEKPVVVSTMVYRQYAGPQIVDFSVAPYDVNQDLITSASVLLNVVVNSADVPSMTPITVGASTISGCVKYTITAASGASYPVITVPYSAGSPTVYSTTWLAPGGTGAADGYYTFRAVAYTATAYPGNTWEFTKRIESGPPGPVTDLTAAAQRDVPRVILNWTGSPSADVDHYLVERMLGADTVTVATLPKGSTAYTDESAVANELYTYTVTAFDTFGNPKTGGYGVPVAVTWLDPGAPPNPALNLKGSQPSPSQAQVVLSWDPPTDLPGITIGGYHVYAAGNTTTPIATVTSTSATIAQGWSTSQYYQVKPYSTLAVEATGWATIAASPTQDTVSVGGTSWVRVTVGVEQLYTVNVTNNVAKNTTFTLWYRGPAGTGTPAQIGSGQKVNKLGDAATWTGLHAGMYEWRWDTSAKSDWVTGANPVVNFTAP